MRFRPTDIDYNDPHYEPDDYDSNNEPVEFIGEIKHETDKAYLVFDGVNKIWLPKSQIMDKTKIGSGGDYEFVIPRWIAEDKGII